MDLIWNRYLLMLFLYAIISIERKKKHLESGGKKSVVYVSEVNTYY